MKKMVFILASLFAFGVFSGGETVKAQVVSVNINIGVQPAWGPVGYDYVEYYYIPEIDCYYNVPQGLFYYVNNGRWISGRYLPPYYSRYDLYRLYKVVVNGYRQPWMYHSRHYSAYHHYVGRYNQPMIRYSRDNRYEMSRRNRYDWVENGRDLHRRSSRSYSEGRSSGNYNNQGRSTSSPGRDVNQGRYSSGNNNNSRSSSEGRYSSQGTSSERPQQSTGNRNYSGGRTSGDNSSSGRSAGSSMSSTPRRESAPSSSSSSSSVRSSNSSSSERSSGASRPASSRR